MQVERRALDFEQYKVRYAKENDCSTLIKDSTNVYEGDELKIVYELLDWDCQDVIRALQPLRWEETLRVSGQTGISRIFGFEPRRTLRRDFCSASMMAREHPDSHAIIAGYASKVAARYQAANPGLYGQHDNIANEKLISDYKLKNTPFTSGIINKDTQLMYHFDRGNFKNVWSAMLVFKQDIAGGYLAVPEYDICFELKNNSLLMFDGQGLLHGVTPIRKLSKQAFRYSLVYYSLQTMWNCLPVDGELERIRKLKTSREVKRSKPRSKEDVVK